MSKEKSRKLPAIMFYTSDWMTDLGVRSCSLEARGLWIDMLSLMNASPQRGKLLVTGGLPMDAEQLARQVGETDVGRVQSLLDELERFEVFSFDAVDPAAGSDGKPAKVIVSRRMLRDEHKRALCSAAGKKGGGNPTFGGKGKGAGKQNSKPTVTSSPSISDASTKQRSASENFQLAALPGVAEVWKSIPATRRRKPGTTRSEIGRAIEVVSLEEGITQAQAVEFLAEKIKAYYQSPEGKGEFWRQPSTWLEQGAWDEPAEAWNSRTEERATM